LAQSDQPQRLRPSGSFETKIVDLVNGYEYVPLALKFPDHILDTRSLPAQDQDRLAVLAFIEYIQTFQEAIDKELIVPFDTGKYYVGKLDLSDAIYGFAYLLNESLREKSLAPVGRKLANIGGVHNLLRNISSCLGFCNLALAGYEDKPFSLAHLIDERPSGFLAPLTDAEWQMLSEKAVADMLERRQLKCKSDENHNLYYYDNEDVTNFRLPFGVNRNNQFCHFFGSPQKYPFANDEAKRAAQAIVAAEKVRLNQFLEALQGTLRFLDRLTRLPQYQEVQLPLVHANRAILAQELITFLTSLLEESIPVQEEPEMKSGKQIRIVESNVTLPATDSLQLLKDEDDDEYDEEEEDYIVTPPAFAFTPSSTAQAPAFQEPERYQPTRKQQTTAEQGKSILGYDIQTNEPVKIAQASRRQGLYILGLQGYGKSGLLENLIIQDIKQGIGVCVLDPKRELTDNVIARLPDREKERKVILLDIADYLYPFGINLFACSDPTNPLAVQTIVDQVRHIFEKLLGVSEETQLILEYLYNCTYTLVVNPGYTMADMPLLLTNKKCRQKLVANVTDIDVLDFWEQYEQKHRQSDEIASTIRRVRRLLQPLIRPIVGQATTTVDLRTVMDEGKILLVKLNSRQLEQASRLIGSMIVALILQASANRLTKKQFNLYADEFQHFATEDFATLIEEARYAGIGVAMAHQNRGQLELSDKQADANLKQRTLSVGNLVVFRVPTDADELARQFPQKPPDPEPEWIEEADGEKEDILVIPVNPLEYLIRGRFIPTNKRTREAVRDIQYWPMIPTELIDELLIAVMERKITIGSAPFVQHMEGIIIGHRVRYGLLMEEIIGSRARGRSSDYEEYYGAENMPEIKRLYWNAMHEVIFHPEKSEQIEQEFYASFDALPVVPIRRRVAEMNRGIIAGYYYKVFFPLTVGGINDYFERRRNLVRSEQLLFRRIPDIIALCEGVLEEPVRVPTGQKQLAPKKHLYIPSRRPEQDMIAEVARLLRKLPLYTARVMVTTQTGLEEHTIRTLKPEVGLYGTVLQERIARIQAHNRTPDEKGISYCRPRRGVEAEILVRQGQFREPHEETPISRHPQR